MLRITAREVVRQFLGSFDLATAAQGFDPQRERLGAKLAVGESVLVVVQLLERSRSVTSGQGRARAFDDALLVEQGRPSRGRP
jgi:hypothetical protein